MRVVPGRDDDQLRLEAFHGGQDGPVVDQVEVVVARIVRHRDVERRAVPSALAHLTPMAGSRKQRPGMRRAVEHARVLVEDILRAVAVMRIPVDDRQALQAKHVEGIARCYRNMVDKAEAHRTATCGVVARRADERKGIGHLPADHRLGRTNDRARGTGDSRP